MFGQYSSYSFTLQIIDLPRKEHYLKSMNYQWYLSNWIYYAVI